MQEQLSSSRRLHLMSLYCAADRDMLKLTQQEFTSVPLVVKAEVLLAAVACMWGERNSTTLFSHLLM